MKILCARWLATGKESHSAEVKWTVTHDNLEQKQKDKYQTEMEGDQVRKLTRTNLPFQALHVVTLITILSTVCRSKGFAQTSSSWHKVTSTRISSLHVEALPDMDKDDIVITSSSPYLSRNQFLGFVVAVPLSAAFTKGRSALAFDGGVGGLGKTKPTTGVQFYDSDGYSAPMQNSKGIVSAEIQSLDKGKPILVQFQTPWPLLPTTSGLEARDLQSSESAFVQVVPAIKNWQDQKTFTNLLMESVLASQGKYGAYGTPTDIKVKPISTTNVGFSVTFTSYTPAMRESERQILVLPRQVDSETLVMLIVGTTRARFASQKDTIQRVADSYQAVAAPQSKRVQ